MTEHSSVEERLKEIKRRTRRKYTAEEKLRIVLEGIKGESSIADLCRREGIHANQYYTWSKEFLEAGKQRLSGNTKREATSPEVDELRKENDQLKRALAEVFLKNQV
jgi:transposase